MRKRIFGKRLSRDVNQRKALFKSLTDALTRHGKIKTTEAKAKAVKGQVEKLITHAKNDGEQAMQYLQKHVHVHTAERITQIAPVFKDRPGGYLRIVKIGSRKKDNAPLVLLEFVEKIEVAVVSKKREKTAVKKAPNTKVKKETKKAPKKTVKKV